MVRFAVPVASPSASSNLANRPRTLIVIPARYASTRLPGKPLLEIAGRTLVEHVHRRASLVEGVERVLVATDDERVVRAVEEFGGTAVLTSQSHASGTDRLAEVAEGLDCDIVVNLQGDEPIIEPAMIRDAIAAVASDPDVPMSTVRRRIDDETEFLNPHVVKVVVDRDGYALYFSRSPIPHDRDGGGRLPAGAACKHIGLYVYRRECLLRLARLEPTPLERLERLEQLRALEHGIRIMTVETRFDSIGVDTPEDLARVRALMSACAPTA